MGTRFTRVGTRAPSLPYGQGRQAAGLGSPASRELPSGRPRTSLRKAMEASGDTGTVFNPGCEPVVEDEDRRRLLWLMAEYFRTVGYTDIKARLPGFAPPPVLSGTLEDHRPDFTCRQSDSGRTPII